MKIELFEYINKEIKNKEEVIRNYSVVKYLEYKANYKTNKMLHNRRRL